MREYCSACLSWAIYNEHSRLKRRIGWGAVGGERPEQEQDHARNDDESVGYDAATAPTRSQRGLIRACAAAIRPTIDV